ncbi:uncharacterized protein JCM6883_004978 [Sporobolomyces salmoneus]|uniref:uncharacterized protein n=1 Tax=Sporobolomyces salmoneus TaxID=183962 RepID=UPI00317A6B8F
MLTRTVVWVTVLTSLVSSVEAFWRLPCGNSLVIERADTIVSPYQISGHVHNILGGSNFALGTTFEELRASECASCQVKQDMSNYWTPHLYFQWANGSFSSVKTVGGGLIYYLPRFHPTDTTNVTAFPDGFRVLTGNPFKRFYDSSSDQAAAIGWNCLGAPVSATRHPYLPPYNCPNGLRGEIRFPSCWNGVDIQSSDHFSHMAYPIGGESGPCPSTHPVRLVTLFYEIMWSVDPWNAYRSQAMNTTQPFVLAQGDATGYGYHGDFFNGWDREVLQEAIDTCTSDSGVIEYCKVFDLYDASHTCRKTPDVDEVVLGTLPALPGCNPVTGFMDGYATPCSDSNPPPTFNNTAAYNTSAPPVGAGVTADMPSVVLSYKDWTYQDCYSDLVNGRALPNGLSTANKTVESCLNACASKNYTYCGVQYHGECWGANKLGTGSTALGSGSCGFTCTDNRLQYCGGNKGPGGASFELYTRPNTTASASSSASQSVFSTLSQSVSASVSVSTNSTSSTSFVWTPVVTASSQSTSSASQNLTDSASQSTASASATNSMVWSLVQSSSSTLQSISSSASPSNVSSSASPSNELPSSSPSSVLVSTTSTVSSTTTVSSTLTSTSSSATVVATPTRLANNADWSYTGCYTDLVNSARSLPKTLNANSTVESCLAAAKAGGFAMVGLSYYGECYAGPAISPYSSSVDLSRCNMPCRNDATKTCGGSGVLDVYSSNTVAALTGPKNLTSFGSWSYDACYKDLVNNQRVLPNQVSSFNKTIEGCLNAATSAGAKVAALSYYYECYYLTSDISSSSYKIDESNCRFPCQGNPNEMCGGSGALSVWRLPSVSVASTFVSTQAARNSTKVSTRKELRTSLRTALKTRLGA